MYELGASPPTGATQFSVTVDPVTVADNPDGADGAASGAAPVSAFKVTRGAGHPDTPNAPAVPLAREKHDHETEDAPRLGPAVPGSCATLMAVDGAVGERPPPPHADSTSNAARAGALAVNRLRIETSVFRLAGKARRS
jgi:hypothetical protein